MIEPEVPVPTNGADGSGTIREQTETASESAARLSNRYDILHLCFEFLISALVLIGSFMAVIVYKDSNITSGAVAVSTLIISYWFGRTRPSSR